MLNLSRGKIDQFDNNFPTEEGVIKTVITPGVEWRVRIHGTYWKARSALAGYNFAAGDVVKTVAREGLTLLVAPTSEVLP